MLSASSITPIAPSKATSPEFVDYILFHSKRHPQEMAVPEIEAFLTHLAVNEQVAASTQNQALSALLFLHRHVLHQELAAVDAIRAKP